MGRTGSGCRTGSAGGGETAAADSSFAKTLAVLVSVAERGPVRADAIATALGLPLSNTYRYLRTMVDIQLVSASGALYAPGPLFRALAAIAPSRQRLIDAAQPVLEDLVVDTRETAILTIRAGTRALCLAQAESPHLMRTTLRIGQLLPLHAGAAGHLLLAFASSGVQERVLAGDRRRFTEATPSADELRRLLPEIRRSRSATSIGEVSPGSVEVAAPVEYEGRIVAALGVGGPRERCSAVWQRAARELLARAAGTLQQHLETY